MAKTTISQKLANALNNAELLKTAGLEEVSTDSAGKVEHGADAEALQDGTASGVTDAKMTAEGEQQPGSASDVMKSSPTEATASTIAPTTTNEDTDAKKELNAAKGEVVADDLKEIEKQASVVLDAAHEIVEFLTSAAFQKQASEQVETEMNPYQNGVAAAKLLSKMASAGDPAAQSILDYQASFLAGMQKKANDVAALVGENSSPEDVAAAEEALNQAAMEDPSAIMEDAEGAEEGAEAEGEEGGEDEEALLQQVGAEAEQEAQELVLDYADAILEANPEMDEESALQQAQEEVADAIATVVLQQQAGDVDENGQPAMSDEELGEAVEEMGKTASAHPDRDALCATLNERIGLDPSAFAHRLGF